jgi:hypothetical protein
VLDDIFVVVEVAEKLLRIVIDIAWLFEEARAEEVVQNLSKFRMIFEVADMFLLDFVLDIPKVGLQL